MEIPGESVHFDDIALIKLFGLNFRFFFLSFPLFFAFLYPFLSLSIVSCVLRLFGVHVLLLVAAHSMDFVIKIRTKSKSQQTQADIERELTHTHTTCYISQPASARTVGNEVYRKGSAQ